MSLMKIKGEKQMNNHLRSMVSLLLKRWGTCFYVGVLERGKYHGDTLAPDWELQC